MVGRLVTPTTNEEKTKAALIYFVEVGDIRQAAKIAEMDIEDLLN